MYKSKNTTGLILLHRCIVWLFDYHCILRNKRMSTMLLLFCLCWNTHLLTQILNTLICCVSNDQCKSNIKDELLILSFKECTSVWQWVEFATGWFLQCCCWLVWIFVMKHTLCTYSGCKSLGGVVQHETRGWWSAKMCKHFFLKLCLKENSSVITWRDAQTDKFYKWWCT